MRGEPNMMTKGSGMVMLVVFAAMASSAVFCSIPVQLRRGGDGLAASGRLLPRPLYACSSPAGRLRLRGGSSKEEAGEEKDEALEEESKSEVFQGESEDAVGAGDGLTVEELVAHGRVAIAEQNFSTAADFLSTAVELRVREEGELGAGCAELYYLYGTALALEADQQDGDELFGPNVPKSLPMASNETDAKEGNKEDGEEGEVVDTSGDQDEGEDVPEEGGKVEEEVNKKGEEVEPVHEERHPEEDAQDAAAPPPEAAEENDDLRTRAWEVLDTARIILQRAAKRTPKEDMMLADVHMRLGDLHFYNELYGLCYEDYSKCLEIRRQHCPPHDRRLLEAHYIGAMSLIYMGNRTQGVAELRGAVEVCKAKLNVCEEREKGEFEAILGDLEKRIEDEEAPVEDLPKEEELEPLVEHPDEDEFEAVEAAPGKAAAEEGEREEEKEEEEKEEKEKELSPLPKKRGRDQEVGEEGERGEEKEVEVGDKVESVGEFVDPESPPKMAKRL